MDPKIDRDPLEQGCPTFWLCEKFLKKNLDWAVFDKKSFVVFHAGLDLDLVCLCESLDVQTKMSNSAKKYTRAVGWTDLP